MMVLTGVEMSPITSPTIAVALYRVSTNAQADSGLGIEAQKASVREYCDRHDITIVAEHTDNGVSGKASLDKRPGLINALTDVVSYRAGSLIVAKMDRLSRDPMLAMTVEKTLASSGARLVSAADEGTKNDDPSQVLLRRILQAVAENEASLCSARTKAALKAKAARGHYIGRPPFGFTSDGNGGLKPTEDAQLVLLACMMRGDRIILKDIAKAFGWSITQTHRTTKRWEGRLDELKSLVGE